MEPSAASPPNGRLSVRRVVGGAVLAIVVYGVFVAYTDLRQLAADFGRLRPTLFLAAVAAVLAAYGLRTARWHFYLSRLRGSIPARETGLAFLAGFALAVTPGKIGELLKVHYLQRRTGTPYPASLAAVVAERSLDLAALAVLLAIGAPTIPALPTFAPLALVVLVALGVFTLRSPRATEAILGQLSRIIGFRRLVPHVRAGQSHLRFLLHGSRLLVGSLLGLAAWTLEAFAMWLLAAGFGIDLSPLACGFVFAAATLAGVLVMVPGGLGVTEGGMVALLAYIHVPLTTATALTLATRLVTLWLGVALGAVALVALRLTRAPALRAPPAAALAQTP